MSCGVLFVPILPPRKFPLGIHPLALTLSTQAMSDSLNGSHGGDRSGSCSRSLAPDVPALPEESLPGIATDIIEQIGGGRRAPSPPPVHTPTRLQQNIKVTSRDDGTVRKVQDRCRMLLPQLPATGDEVTHNDPDPFVVEPFVSLQPPASMHQATADRTKGSCILMNCARC
jgi:hypothetical protein